MSPHTNVARYAVRTTLPLRDIALVFRDNITRPAGAFARQASRSSRLIWEFSRPGKSEDPFDEFEPADQPTYQVAAHWRSQKGLATVGSVHLKIWDRTSHRDVEISHIASLGERSCVRNVLDHLRALGLLGHENFDTCPEF